MDIILKQLFVGKVTTNGQSDAVNPLNQVWESGIFKNAVNGKVFISKTNIEGDEQADLVHHGGPEKAIFAYPSEHYAYIKDSYPSIEIDYGGHGENFLLANQLETDAAIGDTYKVGEAVIQISQPRQPCWKFSRRYKTIDLALNIQKSLKTGWYYRVIKEGFVYAGDKLELIERPYPEFTIEKCNYIMHESNDFNEARRLSECKLLAANWQETLMERVSTGEIASNEGRLFGPNRPQNI